MVLALAVIHHLAISNNVPLPQLADYFAQLGTWLVIEFVPKSDSQVQRLLASRKDIFTEYNQETFEAVFSETYAIRRVGGSSRLRAASLPDGKKGLNFAQKIFIPIEGGCSSHNNFISCFIGNLSTAGVAGVQPGPGALTGRSAGRCPFSGGQRPALPAGAPSAQRLGKGGPAFHLVFTALFFLRARVWFARR